MCWFCDSGWINAVCSTEDDSELINLISLSGQWVRLGSKNHNMRDHAFHQFSYLATPVLVPHPFASSSVNLKPWKNNIRWQNPKREFNCHIYSELYLSCQIGTWCSIILFLTLLCYKSKDPSLLKDVYDTSATSLAITACSPDVPCIKQGIITAATQCRKISGSRQM